MIPLAASTLGQVLAIIGLLVGLVVFGVVIFLLQGVLTPLRKILTDVESAKTAPMLERGVPGTDQLGTTRRLAESVPPLALAYLDKLGLGGRAGGAPAAPAFAPPPPAAAPSGGSQWDAARRNLPEWLRNQG